MTWISVHAAEVVAVNGSLKVQRGFSTFAMQAGVQLVEGDEANSSRGAEAVIRFDDGAQMALRSDSLVQFKSLQADSSRAGQRLTLRIVKGGLRYISGKATVREKVLFQTSTGEIGIRGTDIEIVVTEESRQEEPNGTYLKVNNGAATLKSVDGSVVEVDPGEVAFGGEPELVPRGAGGMRRPAARKVKAPVGVFQPGMLDKFMQ